MQYNDLTIDTVARALSYLDYDDHEEWLHAGMAIESWIGDAGLGIWLDWSSNSHKFNAKEAKKRWQSFKRKRGIGIGSLIFLARKNRFVFDEKSEKKVSEAELKRIIQYQQQREMEAAIEEEKRERRYVLKAKEAASFFNSLPLCPSDHPYLERKMINGYGVRIGDWSYYDDQKNLLTEKGAIIVPLFSEGGIQSLQAIFADGTKKILWGAKKEGAYFVIGDTTETVVICEGYATGCTIHEHTGLQVFVAIDAYNLPKVAIKVREMMPLAKILIAADNDQYKRTNTGLKVARKACCEVDADLVFPKFVDTSSKPTDFNDLYALEGEGAVEACFNKHKKSYNPVINSAPVFDSWDLDWIENAQKVFNESGSQIDIARAALYYALQLSAEVPAFRDTESIRKEMEAHVRNGLLSHLTVLSIMKRVQWAIFNRQRIAMTSVKPESWDKFHDHVVVSTLEGFVPTTPVTIVFAPMASGKTKKIIKPFSQKSESLVAIAHRRSLIADLSRGLEIPSYEHQSNPDSIAALNKLAICLPSTQSIGFRPFMSIVKDIAVDEISQNIRFTSSRECRVNGASEEAVFFGLKDLINTARNVLVCDASIDQNTMSFMEFARADRRKYQQRVDFLDADWDSDGEEEPEIIHREKFTIVEQVPQNTGRTAYIYKEREDILAKIRMELDGGGNVWLAVESAEKAQILAQIFGDGIPHLMITSKNSKKKEIKTFLENIEEESRKYRLVIASPAISSGVSVEHSGSPHFTMIAGMASGHSICFSDFAQMLGRVRYVRDYHIHLTPNNKRLSDSVTYKSILEGQRQAAAIEGSAMRENEYSKFKAQIEATEEIYRADFSNGLVWFLEYFCFEVRAGYVTSPAVDLSERMKELAKESKQVHRMKIKEAKKINRDQADVLASVRSLTEEQEYSLLAYRLRASFKFDVSHEINDLDLDAFENMRKVDRFARMLGLSTNIDDSALNIGLRKFEKAQIEATKIIFDGVDFEHMTTEMCDAMIARVAKNENRFLLSALKLVPSQYGKWSEGKDGKLKEYPLPTRSGKAVAAILEKFGLNWKRRSGTASEGHYYAVTSESYKMMEFYAKRRYEVVDNGLYKQ